MIKYYSKSLKDSELKELPTFKIGSWIYIEDSTEEELTKIAQAFSLDLVQLKDALDPNEVPRLEIEETNTFIFTRVPYEENDSLTTIPLLFVLSETFFATLCQKHVPIFDKFLSGKVEFFTTQKVKLFIQFFSEINASYNNSLTSINRKVYNLSVNIEKIRNKDVVQFVTYEYVLNDFLNALVRINTILDTLLSGKTLHLFEEDREMVEDLFLANDQLIVFSKSSLLRVKNIRDAYSTILTNNLNRVIKLLTSLTIILTVPTIIASIYGMNVKLPFGESPLAFFGISGVIVLILLFLILIFAKKDWL